MKTVTLPEGTVETLVQASRMGLVTMERQARHTEDRYERNNIQGLIRRTEEAIQSIEGMIVAEEISKIQSPQKQGKLIQDIGDISESKMNWIEGRR